jgi:hypothetical protein
LLLIFKVWKSNDILFFKICLTAIAPIPFLGPFFVLWIANFPSRQHPAFQDRRRFSSDVFDRWRNVLSEKNPHAKLRMWQAMFEKKEEN